MNEAEFYKKNPYCTYDSVFGRARAESSALLVVLSDATEADRLIATWCENYLEEAHQMSKWTVENLSGIGVRTTIGGRLVHILSLVRAIESYLKSSKFHLLPHVVRSEISAKLAWLNAETEAFALAR